MYDKVLLVYASTEQQVQRLCKRDSISEEEAANILKAQMPIDEKMGYADFVVRNETDLKETRRQVEEIWQALKEYQQNQQKS
jgi:dephospho-CoA kinase